uniref:arf-GAP domain and FG repeat-containing protein 1-like isoform X2 n=1 Tax=Myxine glutinosa TaxID=7769 RepID=UPI00358DD967
MAGAARKRQEEKEQRVLRELVTLPGNRRCFDCDQRGPTYANITVGAFVCTACGGLLRGLNPPHRVKSISMTTFSQQEIEFLQNHGNEICRSIWLGLYKDGIPTPDHRDPMKVKEFLQAKYENKRWYVPAEQARVLAAGTKGQLETTKGANNTLIQQPAISVRPISQMSKPPPSKPFPTSMSLPAPGPATGAHTSSSSNLDLLADLGSPFARPSIAPVPQNIPNAGAPRFDLFATSGNTADFGAFVKTSQSFPTLIKAPATMSFDAFPRSLSQGPGSSAAISDKYAVFAELQGVFGPSQAPPATASTTDTFPSFSNSFGPSPVAPPFGSVASSATTAGVFRQGMVSTAAVSTMAGHHPPAGGLPSSSTGFASKSSVASPFPQTAAHPGQGFPQPFDLSRAPVAPAQVQTNGFTFGFGQPHPGGAAFPMGNSGISTQGNPFMGGTGMTQASPATSTNPFM